MRFGKDGHHPVGPLQRVQTLAPFSRRYASTLSFRLAPTDGELDFRDVRSDDQFRSQWQRPPRTMSQKFLMFRVPVSSRPKPLQARPSRCMISGEKVGRPSQSTRACCSRPVRAPSRSRRSPGPASPPQSPPPRDPDLAQSDFRTPYSCEPQLDCSVRR